MTRSSTEQDRTKLDVGLWAFFVAACGLLAVLLGWRWGIAVFLFFAMSIFGLNILVLVLKMILGRDGGGG